MRVVNAWHPPRSTDTNLGTITSVFVSVIIYSVFTTTVTHRSALSVLWPDPDLGEEVNAPSGLFLSASSGALCINRH